MWLQFHRTVPRTVDSTRYIDGPPFVRSLLFLIKWRAVIERTLNRIESEHKEWRRRQ